MDYKNPPKRLPAFKMILLVYVGLFLFGFLFMNIVLNLFASRFYPSMAPGDLVSYKHAEFPIALERPSGWELREKSSDQINDEDCFSQFYGHDPKICMQFNPRVDDKARGELWAKFFTDSFPNLEMSESVEHHFEGFESIQYNYSYKVKHFFNVLGTKYRCRFYLVLRPEGGYIFRYCSHEVNFVQYLPLFEEIMQGVRFE